MYLAAKAYFNLSRLYISGLMLKKIYYFAGMKRNYFIFLLLLCFLHACKSKDKQPSGKSENNLDAARNFIRSALDGKFDEARNFMLADSINNNYMDVAERSFNNASQPAKDSFRTSNIIIHNINELNDSATVIVFSNSYKKEQNSLKVLKINNQWLIDLKYLYEQGADSIPAKSIIKDSLK
jgi:hypothetical protein